MWEPEEQPQPTEGGGDEKTSRRVTCKLDHEMSSDSQAVCVLGGSGRKVPGNGKSMKKSQRKEL